MREIRKIAKPNLDHRSDEELMQHFIQTKKAELFAVIYQRHFVSLSKYLNWLIDDLEQAKDIAQNIFIKIHDNPSLFDPSANFKVWLLSIAKNQWRNVMRKKSFRRNSLKEFSEYAQHGQEEIRQKDDFRKLLVKKAMKELTANHKEVIVLKYSNNLRIHEIAVVLNCSEGTVKSRLFYALNNLKNSIKKERS